MLCWHGGWDRNRSDMGYVPRCVHKMVVNSVILFFSLGKKFIFYFFMDDDYDEEEDMSALLTVNLIILV